MSQTVTVLASTKAGKSGDDEDLVDQALGLVVIRAIQDRTIRGFRLSGDNPTVSKVEGCNFLTNEGLSEDIAMTWLDKVDTDGDSHIHIDEINDHFDSEWIGGDFYGQAYDEVAIVHRKFLSFELAETFHAYAGVAACLPIPASVFRSALAILNKDFGEEDIDAVFATVGKGNEGTENDGITSSQLAWYFQTVVLGGYRTGQGSKSSKSRAEDVHTKFAVSVVGKLLKSAIRGAVGHGPDSMEDIQQTVFVLNFHSAFGVSTDYAATLFYKIDRDQSNAIDYYEVDNAVSWSAGNFIRTINTWA